MGNETEQDKIKFKKNNNDNKKQISNHKPMTDRVCWKWINFKCWKGEDCTFEHPSIYRKHCKKKCDLYHPQVYNANLSFKICKWGEKCKFRHLYKKYTNIQP